MKGEPGEHGQPGYSGGAGGKGGTGGPGGEPSGLGGAGGTGGEGGAGMPAVVDELLHRLASTYFPWYERAFFTVGSIAGLIALGILIGQQ